MIQQAKYLGVSPWELARQPTIWRVWAQEGAAAEAALARRQARKAERQRSAGGR